MYICICFLFFRILCVGEEDKSVPLRDENTGFCTVAKPGEVGLIMNIVNNSKVEGRFDGYSDPAATSKKGDF